MVTLKLPLSGACLCGSVTITADALPLLTVACHCRDCQKFTASAFSLTSMFPAQAVTLKGALSIGGLRSEGRRHYFCASCKNFVYSQIVAAPERINLRTSLLDQGAEFAPFVQVMMRDKMPWVDVPAVHAYDTAPASAEALQALVQAYVGWRDQSDA